MNKKINIWLDDIRDPKTEGWQKYIVKNFGEKNLAGWVWVKTAEECIEFLKEGNVEAISFDHDLGTVDGIQEKTGYDVICWIEEQVGGDTGFLPPRNMKPHSSNFMGFEKIKAAIEHVEAMMVKKFGENWQNKWDNKE